MLAVRSAAGAKRLLSRCPEQLRRASAVRSFASSHERKHSEKRVVPFSPAEVYDVVADVDRYSDFVPWCNASKVIAIVDDKHIVADLSVGFSVLSEKYSSVITLDKPRYVKVDVPRSRLFEYLVNDWYFEQGIAPQSTILSFNLRFAFRNPLYQRVTDLFFEEVVKKMVTAFETQCHALYGRREAIKPERRRVTPADPTKPAEQTPGVMRRW